MAPHYARVALPPLVVHKDSLDVALDVLSLVCPVVMAHENPTELRLRVIAAAELPAELDKDPAVVSTLAVKIPALEPLLVERKDPAEVAVGSILAAKREADLPLKMLGMADIHRR